MLFVCPIIISPNDIFFVCCAAHHILSVIPVEADFVTHSSLTSFENYVLCRAYQIHIHFLMKALLRTPDKAKPKLCWLLSIAFKVAFYSIEFNNNNHDDEDHFERLTRFRNNKIGRKNEKEWEKNIEIRGKIIRIKEYLFEIISGGERETQKKKY